MNDLLTPARQTARPTATRYMVLLWLCAVSALAYTQRGCINVAEEDIRNSLCLTEQEMGWVMSAFFLSYAVCQVPAGWVGHVWGTRRALAWFCFLWSVATGLLALAGGLPGLLLGRLGMGAAQAGVFPCATGTLARWFPLRRRSFTTGVLASFMSVGGAVGTGLTGVLLTYMSWRGVFIEFALPGLLWAVLFFLWFRDRPGEHPEVNAAELDLIEGPVPLGSRDLPGRSREPSGTRAEEPPEPTPWLDLLRSRKMWWVCGQQFFRAAGQVFFLSWFATFLKKTHGVSTEEAGWLTSLPMLGLVVGSVQGGLLSDWLLARTGSLRLSRQGLSVVSQLACTAFMVLAYFAGNAWLAVLLITAGWLCAAFAGPCAYSISMDMGGRHVPTVFSMMNMAGNLGAAAFPLVVPGFVAVAGWNAVLFLLAGISLAAAACWGLLDTDGTVFD